MKYAFMGCSTTEMTFDKMPGAAKKYGYDGYLSGEWIRWEPFKVHLPREVAQMKSTRTNNRPP